MAACWCRLRSRILPRARARGWKVHGCEPSLSCASRAQERLGCSRITRGSVEAVSRVETDSNLFTAWDVVEHIFEPAVPTAMRQLLAPSGRIFLRTPNLDYVLPLYRLRRRLGEDVRLGPLNHVVYFTARTMCRALVAAGLEPAQWLALPPPQVATFESAPERRYAPRRSIVLSAKNAWAKGGSLALRATRGQTALTSDLDVLARPLETPEAGSRRAASGAEHATVRRRPERSRGPG
jgi:hypothetical protein